LFLENEEEENKMLLYLSSYKLGNEIEVLKNWIKNHENRIILIANSRDWSPESAEKEASIERDSLSLQQLGFEVKRLDLRQYFGKEEQLKKDLEGYYAFYVIGGNTFTLRLAMKYSGFDNYLKEISSNPKYLYAGYSAGICVLAPRLNGLDLVDEPINPYNNDGAIYEGVNILDFVPVPHYKSDHPESHLVDKVVDLFEEKKVKYKALKDGDVIILNKELERE